jgi:hypothetical protein
MSPQTPIPKYSLRELQTELQGESDRAAAIVGTAWLDDLLASLLAAFLVSHSETKRLLGTDNGHGPISTLGNRVKLAFCLGLLLQDEMDDLLHIATIRNLFAHKIHRSSFDDTKISDHCLKLKRGPLTIPIEEHSNPRNVFIASVALISFSLSNRREATQHRTQLEPPTLADLQSQVAAA